MTRLAEWTMLSHGWRRFVLLLLAGAIAGLSVPPLFILPALFVSFPLWVWALDGAERRRGLGRIFGPAFGIGFAFGWGYFVVAFHWLGAAFLLEGGLFLALMPVAIAALAALIALFWGLASALAHLMWSHGPARIIVLAAAISAAEFARGTLFTGFPFDLVGYALTANLEMMQLASVVGVYGLTALALLLALTPALIWPADGRGLPARLVPFFLAIGVIALQLGYGQVRLSGNPPDWGTTRVRLVQPLVTEHSNWALANPADIITRLIDLSNASTGPKDQGLADKQLLIWPESVFPFFMSQYPDALARIARMLPEGTTLLTGAPREPDATDLEELATNPGYNSLLAIASDGEIIASYDKTHLVPFGEYLPFAAFWQQFGISQFVPGTAGWAPGRGSRLVSPPGLAPFVALICYEAIFSGDLGADPGAAAYILNISNDEWFDGSIGPAQHAHHALLRAVETGLPMLRATNSGVTFASDGYGRVQANLPAGVPTILDVTLPAKAPETVFDRFGNWPFLAAVGLGLLVGIASRRRNSLGR